MGIISKKIISILLLFVLFFPINLRAQSQHVTVDGTVDTNIVSPGVGDAANEGMTSIFDSLGVNTETLSSTINTFNVYQKKQLSPQVSLTFSPANPKLGEKITATAIPTYFMNDSKKMYFTWFLKLKDCDNTDDPSPEEKEKCDLNKDDRVDIEDYKIRAMRIIANNDFSWESADYAHSDGDSSYSATFGGEDQKGKNSYCYVQDVTSGTAYQIECNTHMFPDASHENTGDGSFGREEEKFWHTNPNSADTAQTGNTDEANVAGLGINSFTWDYNSGDEVGVVVEGIAINSTQTDDSSYKTMWAAPNGLCYKTSIGEGTMSSVSDIRDCLYDNLISPSEDTPGNKKLEATLSYSPTSPINDPNSYSDSTLSNGDTLNIQSSIINATDNTYLQYSWQVFTGDDPVPDSWGNPIAKSDLPNATQMEGLGLDSFKFKLNLPKPKKYINVKLTVKENVDSDISREGHANVVIPLNSNKDTISAFSTATTLDSGAPIISMADEICTDSISSAVCPIAKDSIIGLKNSSDNMTDFLWTIDGKPFSYQSCFFNGCDPSKQTNAAFFPILKEVGGKYTVSLVATNSKTGEKISLSRVFQVINPKISISSADESVCRAVQLGNYIDLDGKEWADNSSLNFYGLANSFIKLKAVTEGFPASPDDYTWLVNGIAVSDSSSSDYTVDENGILTIATGLAGENYEVSILSLYSQDNPTKIALRKYWNVPYNQLYEKNISKSITINIQDGTATTAMAKSKKIMATIYGGVPAYLAFLLRIVLTMSLIIFVSRTILVFFPEINRED